MLPFFFFLLLSFSISQALPPPRGMILDTMSKDFSYIHLNVRYSMLNIVINPLIRHLSISHWRFLLKLWITFHNQTQRHKLHIGQRIHQRRQHDDNKTKGPSSNPLNTALLPGQVITKTLLQLPRRQELKVPHPNHLLLRQLRRQKQPASVRPDHWRYKMERCEYIWGLLQGSEFLLRDRCWCSGEDTKCLSSQERKDTFLTFYIGFRCAISWGYNV